MGKIIAEGITFDDVLLVPQYSEVIPNQVSLETHLTIYQVKHSYDECRNGHGYREPYGDRHGETGWNRYYS